jgi:hypothetical protein
MKVVEKINQYLLGEGFLKKAGEVVKKVVNKVVGSPEERSQARTKRFNDNQFQHYKIKPHKQGQLKTSDFKRIQNEGSIVEKINSYLNEETDKCPKCGTRDKYYVCSNCGSPAINSLGLCVDCGSKKADKICKKCDGYKPSIEER